MPVYKRVDQREERRVKMMKYRENESWEVPMDKFTP